MPGDFTLVVVGRNEAERLHVAVQQAIDAARPGDRVVYVDSGSDDDSVARATGLGVDVVKAPVGKGAAIAAAREQCATEYMCFVDGDMEWSSHNIFAELRGAVTQSGADMVVGVYREPIRRWAVTPGIYIPLVTALFADAHARGGIEIPLSGLRAWRTGLDVAALPRGYGVETYLNLTVALGGYAIANHDLGEFRGPLRGFANLPAMGVDVGAAILDLATAEGRLDPSVRPDWDAWVAYVADVIRTMPPPGSDDADYRARLTAAAARLLPSPTGR